MYICFAVCLYGSPAWGVGWPLGILNDPFHAHDTLPSSIFALLFYLHVQCWYVPIISYLGFGGRGDLKQK